MAYFIKALLETSATEYYKNVTESLTQEQTATNIVLCNTHTAAVKVKLSFTKKDGDVTVGYVLFDKSLAPAETILVSDRIIPPDGKVIASAEITNVVVLSVDILNDDGEYSVPL